MTRRTSALALALGLVAAVPAVTQGYVVFADGFEYYAPGVLDKNHVFSSNPAPNGIGANPWWGPGSSPNFNVVSGTVGGVSPHSGSQMIRGDNTGSVHALLWNNIAYRDNAGANLGGNLRYDFWFYDSNGTSNGSAFRGNSALAFYDNAPADTDYPTYADPSLSDATLSTIQRLQLGAANYQTHNAGYPQTFDPTKYQARLIGSTLGYNGAGWINLPLTRSVGWHHGEIVVGPADANGFNAVSYYIDDLTTPLLTGTTDLPNGYNTLEFTAEGSAPAYFDDAVLVTIPEPATLTLLALAPLPLVRRGSRRRA